MSQGRKLTWWDRGTVNTWGIFHYSSLLVIRGSYWIGQWPATGVGALGAADLSVA